MSLRFDALALAVAAALLWAVADPLAAAAPAGADEVLPTCLELIHGGRYADARRLLEAALAERPDWAEGQVWLALTYVKEGRWETARKLYERARQLDPARHALLVPYGWCLYFLGELEDSRRSFEAYLEIYPNHSDSLYALALIAYDGDDSETAVRLFKRVVQLTRARGDAAREALAHARLGDVYARTGDLGRARLELKQAVGLDPGNAKARFKLSRVLRLLGDTAAADEEFKKYGELLSGAAPRPDGAELLPDP